MLDEKNREQIREHKGPRGLPSHHLFSNPKTLLRNPKNHQGFQKTWQSLGS